MNGQRLRLELFHEDLIVYHTNHYTTFKKENTIVILFIYSKST